MAIEGGFGQRQPLPEERQPTGTFGSRAVRRAQEAGTKLISIPLWLILAPTAKIGSKVAEPKLVKILGGVAYATAWTIDTILRGAEKVVESGLATRTIQGLTPATRGVVERSLEGQTPPTQGMGYWRYRLYKAIVPWGGPVTEVTEAVTEAATFVEKEEKALEKARSGTIRRGLEYGIDVVRQLVPGFFRAIKTFAITPTRTYLTSPMKAATYTVWTHPEKLQQALENAEDRTNSYSSRLWHCFSTVYEPAPKEKLPIPSSEGIDPEVWHTLSEDEQSDIIFCVCSSTTFDISEKQKGRFNKRKPDAIKELLAIYQALPPREKSCLTPSLFRQFDELSKIKLLRIVYTHARLSKHERETLMQPDFRHVFKKGDWATIPASMRNQLELMLVKKFNQLADKHKQKMLALSPEQYAALSDEQKERLVATIQEACEGTRYSQESETLTIDATHDVLRLFEKAFTSEERFFLLSELSQEQYVYCPTTRDELSALIKEQQDKLGELEGSEREKTEALILWLENQQKAFFAKGVEEIPEALKPVAVTPKQGVELDLAKIDEKIGLDVGPIETRVKTVGTLFRAGIKALGLASWVAIKGVGYIVKPHGIQIAEDSPLRKLPLFARYIAPDGYLVGSQGLSTLENWLEVTLKTSATAIDLILLFPILHPLTMQTVSMSGIPAYAVEEAIRSTPATLMRLCNSMLPEALGIVDSTLGPTTNLSSLIVDLNEKAQAASYLPQRETEVTIQSARLDGLYKELSDALSEYNVPAGAALPLPIQEAAQKASINSTEDIIGYLATTPLGNIIKNISKLLGNVSSEDTPTPTPAMIEQGKTAAAHLFGGKEHVPEEVARWFGITLEVQGQLAKAKALQSTSQLAMTALTEIQRSWLGAKLLSAAKTPGAKEVASLFAETVDPRVAKTMKALQMTYHVANATHRFLVTRVTPQVPHGEVQEKVAVDEALTALREKSLGLVQEDEAWERGFTKTLAEVTSSAAFTLRMVSGSFLLMPEALRLIVPPMLHELAAKAPKGTQSFFYSLADQSYEAIDQTGSWFQNAIDTQGKHVQHMLNYVVAGRYVASTRIQNFMGLSQDEQQHLREVALQSTKLSEDERAYLADHHDEQAASIILKAYDRLSAQEKLLISPTYFTHLEPEVQERIIDLVEEKIGLKPHEATDVEKIAAKFNTLSEEDKERITSLSIWEFTNLSESEQNDIFFAVAHTRSNPVTAYHKMRLGLSNKELASVLLTYSKMSVEERSILTPTRLERSSPEKIEHVYNLVRTYRADLVLSPNPPIDVLASAFNRLRPQQRAEFLLLTKKEIDNLSQEHVREIIIFLMGIQEEASYAPKYKECLSALDYGKPVDKEFLMKRFNGLSSVEQATFRDELARDEQSKEALYTTCENELNKIKARLTVYNDKLARHESRFQGMLQRQKNAATDEERARATQSLKDRAKLIDSLHAERSRLIAEASPLKDILPLERQKPYNEIEATTLPPEWLLYMDEGITIALDAIGIQNPDKSPDVIRAQLNQLEAQKLAHQKTKRTHVNMVIDLDSELQQETLPEKKIELRMKIAFIKAFYYKLHDKAIEKINSLQNSLQNE